VIFLELKDYGHDNHDYLPSLWGKSTPEPTNKESAVLLQSRLPTIPDAYLERKTVQGEQELSEKEPGQPEGMAEEIHC